MALKQCSAVYLGRSVTQGSVTPGYLTGLIEALQSRGHIRNRTCCLEFSEAGLTVQIIKKDEGFESDGGESDISGSTPEEDEFYPLGDLVFCHTDGNVVVWVVRSSTDGMDAMVFRCPGPEQARSLYQVFNDVSKRVKFDRYCRARHLDGSTVVISLQKDIAAATLPRPTSRIPPPSLATLGLQYQDPTLPEDDNQKWNLVHHTDESGLTFLEIQDIESKIKYPYGGLTKNQKLNRYYHNKGPAPIPPPRKHPINPKLMLVPLKSEESKRNMYPKEPHFVRGNFTRVSLVPVMNYHPLGFSRVEDGRSSFLLYPRRSLRRHVQEEARSKRLVDLTSLSHKLREMVLSRRLKAPSQRVENVKSVMKKATKQNPENKKVTFNAFATVQVMK